MHSSQKVLFFTKSFFLYAFFAFSFSLIGIFLPYSIQPADPLASSSPEHILGHILWGSVAGILSLRIRYVLLMGLFSIILDADHLVNFLGIDSVPRMGHSLPFAIFSFFSMLFITRKKDYFIGTIACAAVFSHISFDVFLSGGGSIRLFAPFSDYFFVFESNHWIYIEMVSILLIVITTIILLKFKKLDINY